MMTDKEFLESMAKSDQKNELICCNDPEKCGFCTHHLIMGRVANEMLESGKFEDGVKNWSDEVKRRWEDTKFFKLWQEEVAAKRNPHIAFEERGWQS